LYAKLPRTSWVNNSELPREIIKVDCWQRVRLVEGLSAKSSHTVDGVKVLKRLR
jgi:hypothetical protein